MDEMGWIKDIYNYCRLAREIKGLCKDGLLNQFSSLYGVPFKIDHAGRMYAVVNPALQNIQKDGSTQIFEFDGNGLSDKTYISQWVMTKLVAVEKLITAHNLLDVLTFDIREILIDGQPSGSYAIIFTPVGFKEFDHGWRNLAWAVASCMLASIFIFLMLLFTCGI